MLNNEDIAVMLVVALLLAAGMRQQRGGLAPGARGFQREEFLTHGSGVVVPSRVMHPPPHIRARGENFYWPGHDLDEEEAYPVFDGLIA